MSPTSHRLRTTGFQLLTAVGAVSLLSSTAVAAQPALTSTTVSTQAQLVTAVAAATPGTVISLNGGTYSGGLIIRKSGTVDQPIVIQAAGTGLVTLTANLLMPACNASSPDTNRTVKFGNGASNWTIQGVTIDGGVYIAGLNALVAHNWFASRIRSSDWQQRRAVPGRGTDDAIAGQDAIPYLAQQTGTTLVPADGIKILDDVITRKGIHVTMGRYGVISGNVITDIACGTGPGIWFGTYSDGWTISGNSVSKIANSTHAHYMQEGIRIDGASNYNVIQNNQVTDLPGGGRAYSTDQDGSYNLFQNNTAARVFIGYSDEMSGWGNTWRANTVNAYRSAGFDFRMMDNRLSSPSRDTSNFDTVVQCNTAYGVGSDVQAGATGGSTFSSNSFHTVKLGSNLRTYWGAQGNTWDGSSVAPAALMTRSLAGC
jgi:hypothetical protein